MEYCFPSEESFAVRQARIDDVEPVPPSTARVMTIFLEQFFGSSLNCWEFVVEEEEVRVQSSIELEERSVADVRTMVVFFTKRRHSTSSNKKSLIIFCGSLMEIFLKREHM